VPGVDNEGRGWGRRPDNRPLTNEPGSPREESAQQRGTLARVENAVEHFDLTADSTDVVRSRVQELLHDLDAAPKSIAWRLRARVGERLRWYEIPEESRR
jgi:hypothetical protein